MYQPGGSSTNGAPHRGRAITKENNSLAKNLKKNTKPAKNPADPTKGPKPKAPTSNNKFSNPFSGGKENSTVNNKASAENLNYWVSAKSQKPRNPNVAAISERPKEAPNGN
jgi:hypothetical protein